MAMISKNIFTIQGVRKSVVFKFIHKSKVSQTMHRTCRRGRLICFRRAFTAIWSSTNSWVGHSAEWSIFSIDSEPERLWIHSHSSLYTEWSLKLEIQQKFTAQGRIYCTYVWALLKFSFSDSKKISKLITGSIACGYKKGQLSDFILVECAYQAGDFFTKVLIIIIKKPLKHFSFLWQEGCSMFL